MNVSNQNAQIIQWASLLIPIMMLVVYIVMVAVRNQYLYKMNYIKYNVGIYVAGMATALISCALLLKYNLDLMDIGYESHVKWVFVMLFCYSSGWSIMNFHITEYNYFLRNTILCRKVMSKNVDLNALKNYPSIVLFYAMKSEFLDRNTLLEIENIVRVRLTSLAAQPLRYKHPWDMILEDPEEEKETLNLILNDIPKHDRYKLLGEVIGQIKKGR